MHPPMYPLTTTFYKYYWQHWWCRNLYFTNRKGLGIAYVFMSFTENGHGIFINNWSWSSDPLHPQWVYLLRLFTQFWICKKEMVKIQDLYETVPPLALHWNSTAKWTFLLAGLTGPGCGDTPFRGMKLTKSCRIARTYVGGGQHDGAAGRGFVFFK